MKRKMKFWMLTLFILSAASVNAQVSIGSSNAPHKGSVLDLSQSESDLGILFPKVYLRSTNDLQLQEDGDIEAIGMVVYNRNSNLPDGVGLYAWDGSEWKSVSNNAGSRAPVTASATSEPDNGNAKITVNISAGAPAYSYIWSKNGNVVWITLNTNATSDSYTTTGAGDYTVTVSNLYTTTPEIFTFHVDAVGGTLIYNENGTQTDSQGNLIYQGITYYKVESDIPGIYSLANGSFVYIGADGIPGNEDDDVFVTPDYPLPTQNTLFSMKYPSAFYLRVGSTYQISLGFAKSDDAANRTVKKYLSSNPAVLSVSNDGLITVSSYTATNTYIVVILDDGSVIIKSCSILAASDYDSANSLTNNILKRLIGSDSEISVNTIKLLGVLAKAPNGSENIYDSYTTSYAIISDGGTGSTLSTNGWFVAGATAGTVTVQVTANATRGGEVTSNVFNIYVKDFPSKEDVYETSFSGNWMALEAALDYAGGSGTEIDPYLISSVRQLKKLSTDIDILGAVDATYEKYFKLTTDLDFEGATVYRHLITGTFYGNFEGGYHLIKNLSINITDSLSSGGIFNSLAYATLKNLGRVGGETKGNGQWVAALVQGATNSTISDCFNTAPITGDRAIGGIVAGLNGSNLNNCYNTGDITGAVNTSHTYTGGLVAAMTDGNPCSIKNSYNAGNVTGSYKYVAGILSAIFGNVTSTLEMDNLFNFGTIVCKENTDLIGAILGIIPTTYTYDKFIISNVRTTPGVVYKNETTLVEPDRMIGYSNGSNKTNAEVIETTHAAQMSADSNYSLSYSQSTTFSNELGTAFKHAPERTPKLAWED
ncbi:MAG: hypothetical protein LBR97_00090 [Dysgonamonadaceae bacterium]|jgi:hypothetical protein|nr:hypothetical protein [Dysgonamonadaceae bacterium]